MSTTYDRTTFAEELISEYDRNEWDGSDSVEEIAASTYAVAVERDDDGWIVGAHSLNRVAEIYLGTLVGTDGYDEWISGVFRMSDGMPVSFDTTVHATVTIDGQHGSASA